MDFGEIPIGSAAGAIPATTLTLGDAPYKKGTRLSEDDIARPSEGSFGPVVVARPAADEVVEDETAHRVGAVVLAAGLSSRMAPASKLLMNLGDRPLIQHVVQTAIDTGLDPVIVVVGHDRDAIRAAVDGLPLRIVDNDDYEEGMASSIRAGVRAIAAEVDAAVFLLGDMPLVAPRHLRPLLAAFAAERDREICIPTYRSKRGNPVLWSARYFPHLLELRGDQGAKVLLREFAAQIVEVEIPDDGVLVDIDTETALETVLSRLTGKRRRSMSIEQLYTAPIQQLAGRYAFRPTCRSPPPVRCCSANRFCGDEVRLGTLVCSSIGGAAMNPWKICFGLLLAGMFASGAGAAQDRQVESEKLFADIYQVLTHPRCLNCHPKGDSPKQGLDAHVHVPPVARGPQDKGVVGLQCTACHQTKNYRASGVPGAPNWHLAPLSMAWENLSQGELCRALLDKSKNGNKDLKAIVDHMTRDELVTWGWAPGTDANGNVREPAPIPKPEFDRIVHAWAKSGAKCPE